MSGGSQHNPGGRQSQIGASWNPLQLQVPNYLGRTPQAAHRASERTGVTWHTPTPPPHLYHAPSPPDLQVMKVGSASGNAVFRHTATPPDREPLLYRHSPTPPDKHYRHTPSPGDVKGATMPPGDLFPHLAPPREKLVRAEELMAYARGGVDLTLGRTSAPSSNGAPLSLSVRDAPTINSLIQRAQPRHPLARVDSLLERLAPSPISPHSVIVHSRTTLTPSPPDSNEDSADSCGAPPGSKRKRKPERTVRLPAVPLQTVPEHHLRLPERHPTLPRPEPTVQRPATPEAMARITLVQQPDVKVRPLENGENSHLQTNGPKSPIKPELPHTRRKTRSGSAETIDDIAAMIASTDRTENAAGGDDAAPGPRAPEVTESEAPATITTIDGLKSVLGSPETTTPEKEIPLSPPKPEEKEAIVDAAVAPKRRSTRSSNSEATNVPVGSPSEGKPAETESAAVEQTVEPTAASFVEVESELEKMFAGIEEKGPGDGTETAKDNPVKNKRRRSCATRPQASNKTSRRSSRVASTSDDALSPKKKVGRKKSVSVKEKKTRSRDISNRDAYDSGSNASSGRSRGPYVQIRGPRDSPLSVNVVNATTAGDDDCDGAAGRVRPPRSKGTADGDFRNGLKTRGLHCSTLSARYDATTPDVSWVCVFCGLGPHAGAADRLEARLRPLGDLFGPYTVSRDCEEYRALDEQRKRSLEAEGDTGEVWFHEECAVWAPGLIAAGSRLSGLDAAVWLCRGAQCGRCGRAGAGIACVARACPARAHYNCARAAQWRLEETEFRAFCPRHA